EVTFSTPLPSARDTMVVGWERGTSKKVSWIDTGAMAGVPLYVGAAGKAQTGTLNYSVVARQTGPSYSYFLGIPKTDHIAADQSYPVPSASLSTLDSTYLTDQPGQDLILWDDWQIRNVGPANPAMPDLPFTRRHAPTSDRRYVSAVPGLRYDGLMLPDTGDGSLSGELERTLDVTAGSRTSLTWRSGLIIPAPSTVDGPCFLCRNGNTLSGVGVMDADADGDIGQWSEGTTTITQDGKKIYQDTVTGVQFDQALAAGKHHYVYTIDSAHETRTTNLSSHAHIAWGFDSATTAKATPVPILYGGARFNENMHGSLSGVATADLSFRHQPSIPDSAVTEAAVSVSYDDGKTWQSATTTNTAHQAHATWTVPATAKPGYLALKVHAKDSGGSTLDETVEHAALVNAPGGIATTSAQAPPQQPGAQAACPIAAAGHARCLAIATRTALPEGFARPDLLSAYKLPSKGGNGTVAIVDAFDDPTAEADLAVYRKTYGLPPCTTANGCFTKTNGKGKPAPLPKPDQGWSSEISLDLDMVSAVCPGCKILLVEADDDSVAALASAERTATSSGAVAVSNSWGGDESSETATYTGAFSHPGVAVTASTGDHGFRQASWPASLANVIAVGGTSLKKTGSGRGWAETAWKGSGSGCSGYTAKPSWQHDAHCGRRTSADVAAVADPATGVAVYDQGGWGVFGGTSASSPIIAAMIALAGNSASLTSPKFLYAHAGALNDVTAGSNANWNCGGDYLCTAGPGYDAPTGLGTPNGLGAL
ncbi:MAG TPA: S53 family peptidase, partial [Amycolatopsis sp.]|nr:S53 family peptidase [Amycolatopsis sp.]